MGGLVTRDPPLSVLPHSAFSKTLSSIVALAVRYNGEEQGQAQRAFFAQERRETIIMRITGVDARGF